MNLCIGEYDIPETVDQTKRVSRQRVKLFKKRYSDSHLQLFGNITK